MRRKLKARQAAINKGANKNLVQLGKTWKAVHLAFDQVLVFVPDSL